MPTSNSLRLSRQQNVTNGLSTNSSLTVKQAKVSSLVAHTARQSVDAFCNGQEFISWIPLELLTQIFTFCAMINPISWGCESMTGRRRFKPGWLNLAYVCRFWRKAAIDHAALWSSQVTNEFGPRWMRTMLERSKDAAVSLRVDLARMMYDDQDGKLGDQNGELNDQDGELSDEDAWSSNEDAELSDEGAKLSDEVVELGEKNAELLARHLFHISDITFTNLPQEFQKAQFNFLRSPAPLLESVQMDVPINFHVLWNVVSLPMLPADFISSQAPRLRRLHLYTHLPPFTTPVSQTLPGLEHLHIAPWSRKEMKDLASRLDRSIDKLSFELSSALHHMKALKTLSLKYCLPPHANNALTENTILDFLNLQSLDIEDGLSECGVFLQHLHIPSAAQVSIHCVTHENEVHDAFGEAWMPVASFMHAHFTAGSLPMALSLRVPDFESSGSKTFPVFEMVVWRSLVAFPSASRPAGFALALTVDAPCYRELIYSIDPLTQALGTLPLASVQNAQYELSLGATRNLLKVAAVLRCTPAVESLWVTGDTSVTAAQALQPLRTTGADTQPTVALLLPALKTLTFWQVDLGDNLGSTENFLNHVRLQAYLQARKAVQGHNLRLHIQECMMKPQWFVALCQVADVSWDGKDLEPTYKNSDYFPDLESILFS